METVYFYRASTHDNSVEVSGYFTTKMCPTKVFEEVKSRASKSLHRQHKDIKLVNINPIGAINNEV